VTVFVSPAEPKAVIAKVRIALEAIGVDIMVHPKPEDHGVDFLWRTRGAWHGVQRKEFSDLLASMHDGRLSKEIGQMRAGVALPLIVVEREPRFTSEGVLIDGGWSGRPFTYGAWIGLQASLATEGVGVIMAADLNATARVVVALHGWSMKPSHNTGTARPGPASTSKWGTPTSREWGIHLLQSFPGVGAETAGAIFDHFGRVPMSWDVDEDALRGVAGVGPKRAKTMARAFTLSGDGAA
jgi:DNA excision repair protein ERCC-4